jgi:hypothetical protein
MTADKRHPLAVTADRLAQHREDYSALLSDDEKRAMTQLETKLNRLASLGVGRRQAWRPRRSPSRDAGTPVRLDPAQAGDV